MPPAQKELLRLPLVLAVFLEVGDEGVSFVSLNDLFGCLILKKDRKIGQDGVATWAIASPLTTLANWMSDRQRLDAPETVLDNFPRALDLLTSEGLIVSSSNRINFFHESLFDFLYARAFVGGNQTVVELLTSTEQHLFRRTQTRQILEALRQNDRGRYRRELQSVLTSDAIRYHIKLAVAQWLGSLADPMASEQEIVQKLDDNEQPFHPIVRHVLLSLPVWFDRLNQDGWIETSLREDNEHRRQTILWWLSSIAGERPVEVSELLETWWGGDPDRGQSLFDWLGSVRHKKPSPTLIDLCVKVIRSKPSGLFADANQQHRRMLIMTWAKMSPYAGSRVLKALFDTWFEIHPGRHPFKRDVLNNLDMHALGEVAEKYPKAFVAGTIDALTCSIDLINGRSTDEGRDYAFTYRAYSGHRFGEDQFLAFFRSALRTVAREDPEKVEDFLSKLDASKHEALLHLHLEAISANGQALNSYLLALLKNENLFEAGWDGADWKSFSDAARAVIPFLSTDDHHRVEHAILANQPEINLAIKSVHEIKELGECSPWRSRRGVIWDLNRSGFEQWCVLESIGDDLLTDLGKNQLAELRRKFSGNEVPQPNENEVYRVSSPIKLDRAECMNDDQWLGAIERYENDEERTRGRDLVKGGARDLALVLQESTKSDPIRFAKLMKRIPNDAHISYVAQLLWGLAGAEQVEQDLLKETILDAHMRPDRPYGNEIVRIFEKYPQIANDPELLDVLFWYVDNGEANEDEGADTSNTDREISSIEDLLRLGGGPYLRGINGVRGRAAEALGTVLWELPDIADKIDKVLERRVEREPLVSVRCCLMRPLVALFNRDKPRCAQLIKLLTEAPSGGSGSGQEVGAYAKLSPLITSHGTNIFRFLLHWVPDTGRLLVERLLESGDETMRMIGAWHVFRRSFQDKAYAANADELIEEGEVYRRLAADVASHAIVSEEFRQRAEQLLGRFFNDDDKEVRRQAANVFRNIEPTELGRFSNLADEFVRSQAFDTDSFSFFHALDKTTAAIQEFVILAAERMVVDLEANGSVGGRRALDVDQLQNLLKREYASSEGDPELRRRLLDVIDMMLAQEIYGTDKILTAYDRWG